jgi:hypothetical protein
LHVSSKFSYIKNFQLGQFIANKSDGTLAAVGSNFQFIQELLKNQLIVTKINSNNGHNKIIIFGDCMT